MKDKPSRKPLFIILLVAIVGVFVAAAVSSPTVTPTKVEEQLDASTLVK